MYTPDVAPGATVISHGPRATADDLHKEANHRIANNLAVIAGLVRLHAANVAASTEHLRRHEVEAILDEISTRIDTVGRLHRLLSDLDAGAQVDLGEHLRHTCEAIVESLARSNRVVLSCRRDAPCLLAPDQAGPVALIVSELVTNAIKHAHPTGVPGKILVRTGQGLAGSVYVDVEDDGIGLPEDFDPWSQGGLGLRVIRGLSQQLNARLIFDAEGIGLKVKLIVPVMALEPA
ncbi:MAG TPA: sensor histidine kinase [Caulobacteraceae bacterium]|nr:sensor histidine kinase [Caulobacteraceae bacterium]